MSSAELLGWHFTTANRKLGYDDGREIIVGETLTVPVSAERPLVLCRWGLHASVRPLDALHYAPGSVVHRVRLSGEILAPEGEDKACASERTPLWSADAATVLYEFAVWCAEQALTRQRAAGREPDPSSWAALEARRAWLRGEITSADLAAAAWPAERLARWSAWPAAAAAAWPAERLARWSAAAAAAAAWPAARLAQNAELERMLMLLS